MLAERDRLAREIHDTLAQSLSSVQLLLHAAQRALPQAPQNAARHIDQARQTAADNLAEARRFVAALTPPTLEGVTLADALERLCTTTSARHRITARFHLTGDPAPLTTAHEIALLRIAQSALSNTVQHAEATTADVTLSYLGDHVALDTVDDGHGFDPALLPTPDPETGGFGLTAHARPDPSPRRHPHHRIRPRPRHRPGRPTAPHPANRHRARGPPVTDNTPIRLLLADDHPVVRAAMRAVLETEPGLLVVAEAANAAAVTRAAEGDIDVVLMDLQFGMGMGDAEATAQITARPGAPRVLIVTTYDSDATPCPPSKPAPPATSSKTPHRRTWLPPYVPQPPTAPHSHPPSPTG
ncbi:CheY-like chemotaxis protein/two-component sensor histidine kinase [Streptomyces sp. SAI-129]